VKPVNKQQLNAALQLKRNGKRSGGHKIGGKKKSAAQQAPFAGLKEGNQW